MRSPLHGTLRNSRRGASRTGHPWLTRRTPTNAEAKPLIAGACAFAEGVAAFDRAAPARPSDVKLQMRVADR